MKDDILDLLGFEDNEEMKNHANVVPEYVPGRYVNMRHHGDRPSWADIRSSNQSFETNIPYFTPDGVGKIRPGTRSPSWDGWCPVLSGGFNPIHPIRRLPLSIRERARIQGFPDDFVFHHDEIGPDRKTWEPYNSDGQRGIKQTGKAMPLQFCTFVAAQVKAHILGEGWHQAPTRVIKPNDKVSEAKREFCRLSGYSNPEAAKRNCWLGEPLEFYEPKQLKNTLAD